jgi:hypothetical protein
VFVGLTTTARAKRQDRASFQRHGFATVDLTHDELAKEHIRHMVGGRIRAGAATSGCCASPSPSGRARC